MTTYIVTEGATDAAVIAAALKPLSTSADHAYKVISAGGGRTGAVAYARSLLMTGRRPVVLIVDSDTSYEIQAMEVERALSQSLAEVGEESDFKVMVVRPEIESLLFKDPDLVASMVGPVSPEDMIKGEFIPKTILDGLLHGRSILDAIRTPDVEARLANLHVKELDDLRAYVVGPVAA